MFLDHPFIGNSMLIPDYGCTREQGTQASPGRFVNLGASVTLHGQTFL